MKQIDDIIEQIHDANVRQRIQERESVSTPASRRFSPLRLSGIGVAAAILLLLIVLHPEGLHHPAYAHYTSSEGIVVYCENCSNADEAVAHMEYLMSTLEL